MTRKEEARPPPPEYLSPTQGWGAGGREKARVEAASSGGLSRSCHGQAGDIPGEPASKPTPEVIQGGQDLKRAPRERGRGHECVCVCVGGYGRPCPHLWNKLTPAESHPRTGAWL